jgi:hypothetical protein
MSKDNKCIPRIIPPDLPRGAMQYQRKSLPVQILFKVDCEKLALQVSNKAMKSKFFPLLDRKEIYISYNQ